MSLTLLINPIEVTLEVGHLTALNNSYIAVLDSQKAEVGSISVFQQQLRLTLRPDTTIEYSMDLTDKQDMPMIQTFETLLNQANMTLFKRSVDVPASC